MFIKKAKVYIIGSKEEYINTFIHKINQKISLLIASYRNGYFKDEQDKETALKEICILKPDVLIVGMGTPAQDIFLKELNELGWDGLLLHVVVLFIRWPLVS